MDINVRRAAPQDTPKIIDLLNQVLTVHHNGRPDLFKGNCRKYTDEQLCSMISDDNNPIFVADCGGVQGYAFCRIIQHMNDNILTDIKTLYIDDLCVDEKQRGQHIGSALFGFVKQYASEIGCYNLTLNVWECNPGAMEFYRSCGLNVQKTGMESIL